LPGMELAVKSMEKKEESWFLIEPEYAFGDMGCPPRVPPKAEVLALIELRDFAQEAEAESLLALDPEARAKEKTYDDIERIARNEQFQIHNHRTSLST
jgi:FK506-binding protein 6